MKRCTRLSSKTFLNPFALITKSMNFLVSKTFGTSYDSPNFFIQ
eukprot:UN19997